MSNRQKSLNIILVGIALILISSFTASAQLTGIKTIPGTYPTLAAAITDLNTQGVGVGGVTFNLGAAETAPLGGYVIGGTGSAVLASASAANPILFNCAGNIITAPTPQTSGALNDGIFKLIGADWVTIQNCTMLENAANTTTAAGTNNMTEWGVALLYVTATDGAQNNTIQSNTIDLDRTYQNTFGIYSNSTHTAAAVTTSVTATGAAGGNDNLKVYTNNITDVNMGIVHVGPTAAADQNPTVDIGGTTAPQGNTITNFGTTGTFSGYANVSGTVNGILVRNTRNFNISRNTVTSSNGGVTAGTLNGIQIPASSNAPTGTLTQTINNNTISLRSGLLGGGIVGITMPSTSVNATTTNSISNNDFNTFGHTVAGATGTITFVSQGGNPLSQSLNGNTFTNISVNTTGTITFFSFAPSLIATGSMSLSSNSIVTGFTRTGVGATTVWSTNASSLIGSTHNVSNNNFSNIVLTGASAFTGISDTDGPSGGGPVKTVNGNTFNNITTGAGTVAPISVNFSSAGTNVNTNTISNITTGNSITCLTIGGSNAGLITASGNLIDPINSAGAAVIGISDAALNSVVSKNKIYDLNGTVAGSIVTGIAWVGTTGASVGTIVNNLVGNLTAPAATSSNSVIGIGVTGSATTSTINVYYNTVYLNNTTTGAGFGSSALFTVASTTATTSTLNLRNNILVNTSVQNGAGLTVAYRRSAGTAGNLANYASTSNNNLFYAGTPSATNLIYADGTSTAQTIIDYKNGVFTAGTIAPRDAASISENPPFLSTVGSNANFLHINPATPTQIESGAAPIAGITDDFDGNARSGSTPDIGADEGAFTLLDIAAPSIVYTAFSNTASTTNRTLSATISDASAVASGALLPRVYFKKSTDGSYFSTQCTMTGGTPQNGTYDCVINYTLVGGGSVAIGDTIQYFVVAQDTAGNLGSNPSAGFSGTSVNTVTTPPTTPNSYSIIAAFPSTVTVGAAGTYTSLTNPGGLFEAMNLSVFTGNTTIQITSDLAGETGTHALNQLNEEGGGAGTYTVTIVPSGAPRAITGSNATSLIKLNGTDRVTINGSTSGGTDRSLTITNTGAGRGLLDRDQRYERCKQRHDQEHHHDRRRRLYRPGSYRRQRHGLRDPAEFPNSNNTLQNNAVTRVQNALFASGGAATPDQNWTVVDNAIGSTVAADKLSFRGILLGNSQNFLISRNTISGILSSTGTSSTMSGMQLDGVLSGTISRNIISDIKQVNTTGWGSNGIYLFGNAGQNVTIVNNFISDIASQGFNGFASTDNGYGIAIETGSGYNIWHNTIVLNTNQGAAAASGQTGALNILPTVTAAGAVDMRNNIFASTQTLGTRYGVIDQATAANLSNSNGNDYFAQNVGRMGVTTHATLLAWQGATGQDAASVAVDPLFVTPTDFHLSGASTLQGAALTTLLALVPADIDTDLRDNNPDIGADEIP